MDAGTVHARRWWTLAVLCFSLLVIGMDNTILNVALPTIQRDLGATASQLQWIVDAYTIVYASILLTTGSLGDRFGRKGILTAGLVVFGLGSVASAFSANAGQLIAFRALAGLGGAMIMPATLSILTNVFPPEERGRAIGIWAGVSGIGIVVGPLVGGWLLARYFWGSVFFVNIPVVIVALVAGHYLVPTSKDPDAPRLDPLGTVLGSAGLGALLYGVIEAPAQGWGDPAVMAGFGFGLALLGAFVIWELNCTHPMLEVRFFRNRRFSGASIAVTLTFFAMFGSMYFLTQYLQFVLGYSPMVAGAALIPLAGAMMLMSPNTARITKRVGTKIPVAAGLVTVACALALMSRLSVGSSYWFVGVVLAVLGLGIATAMAPATESIMGSLPPGKAGVGSAMNDTTRQVGGALGVAVLGSLTAASYHHQIASSKVLAALPPAAAQAAHDSIGGAVQVAGHLGAAGHQLVADASAAFVHGMSTTLMVASVVALCGAAVAMAFLPARPPDAAPEADIVEELAEDRDAEPGAGRHRPALSRGRGIDGRHRASAGGRMTVTSHPVHRRDRAAEAAPDHDPTVATRGRPRSVEADLAIAQATLDLLAEEGYSGLTMAAVAQRAKVSSATLYRRFDNKEALVASALAEVTDEHRIADTGSLAGDVHALLTSIVERLSGQYIGLVEALVGEAVRNTALSDALRERFYDGYRRELTAMIDRAVARDEMAAPADLSLVSNVLMGPLYYRWLVARDPLSDRLVDDLTPMLVAALTYGPADQR